MQGRGKEVKFAKMLLIACIICVSFAGPVASQWSADGSSTLPNDCDPVVYNGSRGLIESYNYPQPYKPNACQRWFIQGKPSEVITISFNGLDIRSDDGSCTDSYINIGPVPEIKLCKGLADDIPITYLSKRNHVWIKFVANGHQQGSGFSLFYVKGEIPSGEACKPDEFQCVNGKCIPHGWKCNGAYECEDKSDEAVCPTTDRLTTPGPYSCGPDRYGCTDLKAQAFKCLPKWTLCDKNIDCVGGTDEVNCDNNNHCGGKLEATSGFFTSPQYPESYPSGADCQWLIHVPMKGHIQLRFLTFDLESVYDTDSVTVYDGGGSTFDLMGTFYGAQPPPKVLESHSEYMYVVFTSDKNVEKKGFNATFQLKGLCLDNQVPCGRGESNCYSKDEKCDGVWHCPLYGGDEHNCGRCHRNMFQCDAYGTQCYSEEEHCNGIGHCSNSRDEEGCTSIQCGPHNGTFLCSNNRCIYESWRCDGTNDCGDHSDEIKCSQPSTKVITAAVIGSLICGLLLVIALGCTCKLYALRLQEHQRLLQQSSTINRVQESLYVRRMAPPPYNEAMATSRPFDEVQREARQQQQEHASGGRRSRRSRRRGSHNNTTDSSRSATLAGTRPGNISLEDDVPLLDIGIDNATNDDRALLIPTAESSSDDDDDDDDEVRDSDSVTTDSSNIRLSMATGMSAQWRRRSQKLPSQANHSTSDLEGQNNNNQPEQASLDSASASNDSVVVIPLDDDSPKVSNSDLSNSGQQSSTTTTLPHVISIDGGESGPGQDSFDTGDEDTQGQDNLAFMSADQSYCSSTRAEDYTATQHQGSDGEDSITSAEPPE